MTYEETEYFRRRERQERAAAKKALDLASRRAHQQMAVNYAEMLRELASIDPVPSLRSCGAI